MHALTFILMYFPLLVWLGFIVAFILTRTNGVATPLFTNKQLREELAVARRESKIAREELARLNQTITDWNKTNPPQTRQKFTREHNKRTPQCLDMLKLAEPVTRKEVSQRFNELAKKFHPDKGGDATTFIRIKNARDEAFKLCRE